MKSVLSIIWICSVVMILCSCSKRSAQTPPFTVSKVLKTDSLTIVNAYIQHRLNNAGLLAIAGKIRADSTNLRNPEIHFLLPGNTNISAGDHSYYAAIKFVNENNVKSADTLKDDAGNVVRLQVWGLSQAKVNTLLSVDLKETGGKQVLGRYIDDYSHTVIIPFKDPSSAKPELYVLEADSAGKIVSATIAQPIKDTGIKKWQVTQHGDYITIKDSVLTQFAADGLGLPFNSIKSGL